jgi:hypothetical protein
MPSHTAGVKARRSGLSHRAAEVTWSKRVTNIVTTEEKAWIREIADEGGWPGSGMAVGSVVCGSWRMGSNQRSSVLW